MTTLTEPIPPPAPAGTGRAMRFTFVPGAEPVEDAVDGARRYSDAAGFGILAPTVFAVRVPEGNYRVTATIGGGAAAAEMTVKAECRRVVVDRLRTAAGEWRAVRFAVNVRRQEIAGGGRVVLDAREAATPTWSDMLELQFLGTCQVRSLTVEPAPDVVTVHIAGDSTVCDQHDEPWTGWGQVMPAFFTDAVAVANHAQSGRSLRSFRAERRLDKLLGMLRADDYVLLQFGHNDMKETGGGVGPFTTFKRDMEDYIRLVRERGATPVLLTPMYRRRFSPEGELLNTHGDYPAATREVAAEQGVTLIDLHEMSGRLYRAMGVEGSKKAFVHYPAYTFPGQEQELQDDSHFSPYGGDQLARCVVEAIRTSGLPLAMHLSPTVRPFDPARPDAPAEYALPTSPPRPILTPEGS